MTRRLRDLLPVLAVAAAFLLAWKLLVVIAGYPTFVLPAPEVVAGRLVAAWRDGIIEPHLVTTLTEILLGFGPTERTGPPTLSRPFEDSADAAKVAAFLIGWGATYFTVTVLGLSFQSPLQLLLAAILIFVGGWIAGSLLVGAFLLFSLNVFGCLQVSAFSALRIEDWKNFLRLKIDSNGKLTIYSIGIRRVPRRWKRPPPGAVGPELVPDDDRATLPDLIEPPIAVKR